MTTYLPGQVASVPLTASNPNAGYTGLSSSSTPSLTNSSVNPNENYNLPTNTGTGGPLTGTTTTQPNPATPVTSTTALTGDALDTYLNDSFQTSPDAVGIMSAYGNQTNAINANLGNSNAATENYYSGQSAEQQITGAANLQTGITNSKGLINPSAMQIIQDQSESLLSSINEQMNTAIASNNSAAAESLANAGAQEMQNLVTARQNFLSNYFSAQTESRAEETQPYTIGLTGAQTQEAQASAAASTAGAALSQAQANSVSQLTPAQVEEALASAGASSAGANQSNASAAQTNALTSFLKTGTTSASDPNVQALVSGAATPQEIQDKYPTSLYGGYAANILSTAQSQGYNLNTGTLSGVSQTQNAQSLGAGGISALGAGATNLLGDWTGSAFSSTPASTSSTAPLTGGTMVTMSGPGGTYSVPSSQVSVFEQNGYTQQ